MPLWFHACEHQLHEGHGKDLSSTGVVDAPKATNIGQVNLISLPPKGLFSTGKQSYVFFLVGPFVYTFASQASEDTGTCSPAPTNPATTTETILLYLRPCRGERQLLYKFEPNLAEAPMAFQRQWHSESPCAIFGFRCPNHLHHYPKCNLGYTLKIGLPNTKVVFQPLR